MARHTWTPAMDDALRAVYVPRTAYHVTLAPVAAALGVTVVACQSRARKLGLTRPLRRTRWTRQRDDDLRALFGLMPTAALAGQLGATRSAVEQRASKLGLTAVTNRPAQVERWATQARRLRILLAYRLGAVSLSDAATALSLPPEAVIRLAQREAAAGARAVSEAVVRRVTG